MRKNFERSWKRKQESMYKGCQIGERMRHKRDGGTGLWWLKRDSAHGGGEIGGSIDRR